jgi:CheY-like chemotaxis protein
MTSASRVLVIDDSDIARQSMALALREAGFDVHELPSPLGATREILRKEIDFVVIDIEMPALRGDRLAALVRANPRFRDISLVLVSGMPETELRRLADEVGADAFIPKTRMPKELVATLQRLAGAGLE